MDGWLIPALRVGRGQIKSQVTSSISISSTFCIKGNFKSNFPPTMHHLDSQFRMLQCEEREAFVFGQPAVGLDPTHKVLFLGGRPNQPHRRCPRTHTLPCNFLLIWEICASDSFPGQAAETELDLFFSAGCACLITSLAVCATKPPPI